jgi:Cft2 family RNA processing exonuclease
MFHYDRGLKITRIDLAVDFRRRQPRGFISHAHSDHMAAHELALCTSATAALYQHRYGSRPTRLLAFGQRLEWSGAMLSAWPAGHIFGSAMLLVEEGDRSLLYTGDFKLSASSTADAAQPPKARVLVMESTFGNPLYRLPPREEVIAQLVGIVERLLHDGRTPVIRAYVLGKSQEVTRIFTERGIGVLQHPLIYAVSRVYETAGCSLGSYEEYRGEPKPGHVVIAPPRGQKAAPLRGLVRPAFIAVTGWAAAANAHYRLGVDYAVPLSDHADYDELIECIERVEPEVVYCTHGPESFVDRLVALGHNAYPLAAGRQLRLFT